MQFEISAANMNELALRMAGAVSDFGFTKNGKPMVASQGLRVLAVLAGFREEHALVEALKAEKLAVPAKVAKDPYTERSFELGALGRNDLLDILAAGDYPSQIYMWPSADIRSAILEAEFPGSSDPESEISALESRWDDQHGWYGRDEWREDVGTGKTKQGYWDWVAKSIEGNGGEEEHCSKCGKPLDEEGWDGMCGDCADVESSLEEEAESLGISLSDAKFWCETHYKVPLQSLDSEKRVELLHRYRQVNGLNPGDAASVAATHGHTSADSATTLETVALNGEDIDLRVSGFGFDAYFEWIDEAGDTLGTQVYEVLKDAKAFVVDLARKPAAVQSTVEQYAQIRQLADKAFEDYDFGERYTVAASNGWEWSSGDTLLTKVVFLEDAEHPNEPTTRVEFVVNVENGVVTDVAVHGL